MSVSAPLEEGRAAFNRGEFFVAHERWEEAWRELAGPERVAVQGLVQIAAGLHHMQGRRLESAGRLLAKGLEKIPLDPPALLAAFDVPSLARDVARLLVTLERPGPPPDPTKLRLEKLGLTVPRD